MNRNFSVFYWQKADRLFVADGLGEIHFLARTNNGDYFYRVRAKSRMPKTIVWLGYL